MRPGVGVRDFPIHFAVTDHPAATWVVQQLRETFPFDTAARHLIFFFDRDSTFSAQVVATVWSFGIKPTRTAYRSPWQNGVAERWVGSVRRELLDHVVVGNERHLRRLLREYVAYDHDDRTHLGLGKTTPAGRPVTRRRDGAPNTRTPRRMISGMSTPTVVVPNASRRACTLDGVR